jgi:hypothetical protein
MLAVNLRIIVLCTSILIDHPTLYFWFEAIVLNAVAFALIRAQGKRSLQLIRWIETHKEP